MNYKEKKQPAINYKLYEFIDILRDKANITDVELLSQTKTNKEDSEKQMKALDIMHKQTTHITVLIIEMIKGMMNESAESEVTKAQKRKYLLTQAIKVCSWINKFDP